MRSRLCVGWGVRLSVRTLWCLTSQYFRKWGQKALKGVHHRALNPQSLALSLAPLHARCPGRFPAGLLPPYLPALSLGGGMVRH